MTARQFGVGWRDGHGRDRALIWSSDLGALFYDDGHDYQVVRRGLWDEVAVRARLIGYENHVHDPHGVEWVTDRVNYWAAPGTPNPDCIICQGEGYFADEQAGELVSTPCLCGDPF